MPDLHTFHIPVLGIGYTVDTPVKVARFGISSVISIMDDQLIERVREYHSQKTNRTFTPINESETDYRAARITAYLNLVGDIVSEQVTRIRELSFDEDNDLCAYFEMLPRHSHLYNAYNEMRQLPDGSEKMHRQAGLRAAILPGSIDVNIMAKVDRLYNDNEGHPMPVEFSDGLSALRGYANSKLDSSLVLSAGYNPRLYNYIEQFADFYPDANGRLRKKIILKVSDFRSALIQGKLLAKKGLWVSEFRIESGLNCGGHAFATDGLLLGPILEEFRTKRDVLTTELSTLCSAALSEKGHRPLPGNIAPLITVQGGIGTAKEHSFLLDYYKVDRTGWGSPFLLVPEATNVDEVTLHNLSTAKKDDFYLSDASPLGVPFNNFRKSSAEQQRLARISKGRPGSPCYKKFLCIDTEFTEEPICTASREYQHKKLKQLKDQDLSPEEYNREFDRITGKDCLCQGLSSGLLLKYGMKPEHRLPAVTICPGPNLAYFSGTFTLKEMIGHIYGKINILNSLYRPNMFISELQLYLDYFKKKSQEMCEASAKQAKYLQTFKDNLLQGIDYYKDLLQELKNESVQYLATMKNELEVAAASLSPDQASVLIATDSH